MMLLWLGPGVFDGAGAGKVVGWGENGSGQTNIPITLRSAAAAVAIAAGSYHSLAVTSDGRVLGWGDGTSGQATPPVGLNNVVAVAAGAAHSLALKSDGTVVAWGADDAFQSDVPPGLTNVIAIAAGDYDSLALLTNGQVVLWGDGFAPTIGGVNLVAIDAYAGHRLAIQATANVGRVVAGGSNIQGESAPPFALTPAAGANGINVVGVAAGTLHSLALFGDGTIFGWGSDVSGQISGGILLTGVRALAAGGDSSLALLSNGRVYEWGFNAAFLPPPADLSNVVTIAMGQLHSLAIALVPPSILVQPQTQSVMRGSDVTFTTAADGSTPLRLQWKKNDVDIPGATNTTYFLGNVRTNDTAIYTVTASNAVGTATSQQAALKVNTAPEIITQPQSLTVSAGSNVAFQVIATGSTPLRYQWRKNMTSIQFATSSHYTIANVQASHAGSYDVVVSNAFGFVFSDAATLTVNLPPSITVPPQSQTVIAGSSATFTVTATGATTYQWQRNTADISGATNPVYTINNAQPANAGSYTVRVGNSNGFVTSGPATLTVTTPANGSGDMLLGWGQSLVFNGTSYVDLTPPTNVAGVVALAAGAKHSLALLGSGGVIGWGDNSFTQAGPPADANNNVAAIAAGGNHSLALKSNSTVVSWGENSAGQSMVPPTLSNVVAIAAGGNHSLALLKNGAVIGWGSNSFGQSTAPPGVSNLIAIAAGFAHSLGVRQNGTVAGWGGNDSGEAFPPAAASNVIAVAAGEHHSMALRKDGTVVCWGQNDHGQAVSPDGLSGVIAIAAGDNHCLALKNDGTVKTWGQDNFGQLDFPPGLAGVLAIAAGGDRSLALKRTPLKFQSPQPLSGGQLRLSFGNFDGSAMETGRVAKVQVLASTNVALGGGSWSKVTNALTLNSGRLEFTDKLPTGISRRFYIVTEKP